MSHRVEQIESTLRRTLAEVLQRDLSDPRLEGTLVSITAVGVSPDLHQAEVKVSVLPEKAQRRAVQALRHAAKHIQALVRKRMALRIVPTLNFRLDEGIKKEAAIYDAIKEGVGRSGEKSPPEQTQ